MALSLYGSQKLRISSSSQGLKKKWSRRTSCLTINLSLQALREAWAWFDFLAVVSYNMITTVGRLARKVSYAQSGHFQSRLSVMFKDNYTKHNWKAIFLQICRFCNLLGVKDFSFCAVFTTRMQDLTKTSRYGSFSQANALWNLKIMALRPFPCFSAGT